MRYMIGAALLAALMIPAASMATEIDANEVWYACDEAAMDAEFPDAGLPDETPRARVVQQLDGPRKGDDLIIVSASTSTGGVFCMLDHSHEVVLYKFRGIEVINRM